MPLLEGLRGTDKMSKSLNNYVGVMDSADEMFGKLMSVSDDLMWRYYLLLTDESERQIDELRTRVSAGQEHPKAAKIRLASRVVTDFHSAEAATAAAAAFEAKFVRGEIDARTLPEVVVDVPRSGVGMSKVIALAGLAASANAASQVIGQGGVRVDAEPLTSVKVRLEPGRAPFVLEVGRRAVRVVPKDLD
jgi:tyrosyl-tRNA synthetase